MMMMMMMMISNQAIFSFSCGVKLLQ